MEQFSLKKYLENPSRKVVTRDGREVEIVKYDIKGTHFPVLYVISNEDGSQEPCCCSKSGMCQFDNNQSTTDIFFADEELTEFEKELQTIISEASHWTSDDGSISTYCQFGDKEIKKISVQILDLARKELQPEFDKEMDKMLAETDKVVYQKGREDALKDLPKWKKMPSGTQGNGNFNPIYLVRVSNGHYFTTPCLSWDEDSMYLELDELENLPKE